MVVEWAVILSLAGVVITLSLYVFRHGKTEGTLHADIKAMSERQNDIKCQLDKLNIQLADSVDKHSVQLLDHEKRIVALETRYEYIEKEN